MASFRLGFGQQVPPRVMRRSSRKRRTRYFLGRCLRGVNSFKPSRQLPSQGSTRTLKLPAPCTTYTYSVESIDADWDDESGQVDLRVELAVTPGPNFFVQLNTVSNHVTVLSQM
jgi:hypothetical protein